MTKQFGKTWWGEYWLKSLEHIDCENRIPRGASYARTGKVREINIIDNVIEAKVRGHQPRPYKVKISIPKFNRKGIDLLLSEIVKRPALISKLLNRELDPEILKITDTVGLPVFPKRWSDFSMICNCPDYAVPCKHIAAVIYLLSQEIDNNPFLIFEMRGVNLLQELSNKGICVNTLTTIEIPRINDLLQVNTEKSTTFSEEEIYQQTDFSGLQDITQPLVHLLPDNPPFYNEGNFRNKYEEELTYLRKNMLRFFKNDLSPEKIPTFIPANTTISHHADIHLLIDNNYKWIIRNGDIRLTNLQLIKLLLTINTDYLTDYQPCVAGLYKILLFAAHLLKNGAVVPQLIELNDKSFMIRWIPAFLDEQVRKISQQLHAALPPDIVLMSQKNKPIQNQTEWLASFFINSLVSIFSREEKNNDIIILLFFKGINYHFSNVGEKEQNGGIKTWLDRFFLTSKRYVPVIAVNELPKDRFGIELLVEDSENPDKLAPATPLQDVLTKPDFANCRFQILREMSLITPFIKGLYQYINDNGNSSIHFSIEEFTAFLSEILPIIRLLNIKVLLPKSLQQFLRPQVTIKIKQKLNEEGGFLSLSEMLCFDWEVAMGDQLISPEEFFRLTEKASGLLKFKGSYFFVNEDDVQHIKKQLEKKDSLSSSELLQTAFADEFEGAPIALSTEVRKLIKQITSNSKVSLPKQLNATLRPYQNRGFAWMYQNMQIGFGSIIADDMGLGKTLQVITLLLKLKEEGTLNSKKRALVIMPTGLLVNWQTEIERFAPSLSTHIYHGGSRNLKDFKEDILLTTYGVLRSDVDIIRKLKWRIAVIDEAQNIKNQDTAQSKSVRSLKADVHIAMSGTPVENRLSEFWSIMDFANKGYLGTGKSFKEEYAMPIQLNNDTRCAKRFKMITAPFMMRRLKSDKTIISDLPDKIEQNEYSSLTKSQVAIYQQTVQTAITAIESETGTDSQSLFKRKGLILQMILALKQICNHPTQYLKNGKMDASLSGKTELLLDMVDSIVEQNEKVLIFTQFREMGDLLQYFLEQRLGEKPMFYHGGCSVKERQSMVERFQNNRADKVFILSLKAAGTGLNLTAASHVIHYDLWWNPAVEAQATDRAYRIGQSKNVHVHRFIVKNTFEEKIDEMIQSKKYLADMTVATGENWIGQLSNKELHEIFE